jgi:hypothetical protein
MFQTVEYLYLLRAVFAFNSFRHVVPPCLSKAFFHFSFFRFFPFLYNKKGKIILLSHYIIFIKKKKAIAPRFKKSFLAFEKFCG